MPTCLQKLDRQMTAVVSGHPQGLVRLMQQRPQKYSWSLSFSLFRYSTSIINNFVFSNFSCWNREKTRLKIRNPGSCLNSVITICGIPQLHVYKMEYPTTPVLLVYVKSCGPTVSPEKCADTVLYTFIFPQVMLNIILSKVTSNFDGCNTKP